MVFALELMTCSSPTAASTVSPNEIQRSQDKVTSSYERLTREALQCRDQEFEDTAHTLDIRDQACCDEGSTYIHGC